MLRVILALLLPWLAFFTIGRPIAGLICLVLQVTVIGWVPAAIWSAYAVGRHNSERRLTTRGGR